MRKVFQNYWGIFTIAAVIIALDQWTKWLVRTNIPLGQSWLPDSLLWLSPYARIVHWYNTGRSIWHFSGRQHGLYCAGVHCERRHHLLLSTSLQDRIGRCVWR